MDYSWIVAIIAYATPIGQLITDFFKRIAEIFGIPLGV